jgi:TolB protein
MSGLLNKDLDISGFFITTPASLIDKELLNEGVEKKEINFNNWRSMGIELVCKGRIEAKDGDLALEAFLYDTLDGTLLLAKRYKGQQGDWRRLVHRLADDIVLTVTGEKGILSSRILFTSGVRNLKEVYMADFDGQNVKKLTSYRNIALSPSVSPEGKYLAYTSYKEGRANLYIKDIEKNTEVYADRSDGTKIGTSWLNKSTIVYSHTAGGHSTIYAYDVEKRDKKALLQQDGILASPKVSPDGKKMLFVSDMYGSPQIFARDNSSGATNRLTYYGTYNSAPAWSPKGDLIVFVSKLEGGFEISTINPDGSNQRVLTNDGAINDSPQFSPEGRYIIYSSQKGGKYGIHIMLFNGDNKRLLKFTDYNEEQPAFMP